MIGQTISHYKILDKIGEGGMGVVYKAEDTKLQRVVALKFLPARGGENEADKARFLQEARAAAALNHPNICTIYGIEEHDAPGGSKQSFIAMEFVDGQTLHEKRGTLTTAKAIEIGIQVADGLAAAHEKGIVHRDIKPDNIMVRKDGLAQVMDFGLAKLRASAMSRLTREGSTVGTAGYMSPEQVQGQDADHRSDIFSLGVLLYEMFTGELPFKGVHETALMYEIVNVDPAPMSAAKPEIDPELDRIVLECLQKEPDERYNAVKDVAKDLKRFKRESSRQRMSRVTAARPVLKSGERPAGSGEPPPSAAAGSRHGMIGYLLAALLAVALVAVVLTPWKTETAGDASVLRFSIDLPPNAPLAGVQSGVAVSRDGKQIAYRAAGQTANQVYLRRLDDTLFRAIQGTERASDPVFSPDGRWLAFRATGGRLAKVSISGGAPEPICPIQGEARGIFWSPEGRIYFGLVNDAIYGVDASGGTPVAVTTLDTSAGEISHRFPHVLPGGKTVVFTVKKNDINTFDDALIVAQTIGGGDRKVLVRGGTYPKYIPTGHLMYLRGNSILAVPFDPDRVEVTGNPVEVGQGGAMLEGAGSAGLDFSENGLMVCAPSGLMITTGFRLCWIDRTGNVSPLFDTLRPYTSATLSPDGQKIATGLGAANNDVWIYNIPRNVLTRLTFGGGNNDYPIWSPDGTFVVYSAEKGKTQNIFRKPWDGSGAEERIASGSRTQRASSFTPDGRTLLFDEGGDIWAVSPDSSGAKPHPFIQGPASESWGSISPDGRWVAYASDESGKREVYVTSYPKREGKWQVSNGGGNWSIWSRDGKELLYFAGGTVMVAGVRAGATFDYSTPRKLLEIPPGMAIEDLSPDGKKFLARVGMSGQLEVDRLDVVAGWFSDVRSKFEGSGK